MCACAIVHYQEIPLISNLYFNPPPPQKVMMQDIPPFPKIVLTDTLSTVSLEKLPTP